MRVSKNATVKSIMNDLKFLNTEHGYVLNSDKFELKINVSRNLFGYFKVYFDYSINGIHYSYWKYTYSLLTHFKSYIYSKVQEILVFNYLYSNDFIIAQEKTGSDVLHYFKCKKDVGDYNICVNFFNVDGENSNRKDYYFHENPKFSIYITNKINKKVTSSSTMLTLNAIKILTDLDAYNLNNNFINDVEKFIIDNNFLEENKVDNNQYRISCTLSTTVELMSCKKENIQLNEKYIKKDVMHSQYYFSEKSNLYCSLYFNENRLFVGINIKNEEYNLNNIKLLTFQQILDEIDNDYLLKY